MAGSTQGCSGSKYRCYGLFWQVPVREKRPWSADAQAALRAKVLQHLKKARIADG